MSSFDKMSMMDMFTNTAWRRKNHTVEKMFIHTYIFAILL